MKSYGWKSARAQRYYFTAVVLTIHFVYFIRKMMRYYFSGT